MNTYLDDRQDIADLMTGWIYRDLAEWDRLRSLFHPDGAIEISWFQGKASDFVDGSMRMGASDLQTKHVIASPTVVIQGDKAIAETNAIILGENIKLGIGFSQHSRFYDQVERRDGAWKIANRQCIYDMASFTFPRGIYEIDAASLQRYPREYAAIGYVLEKSGFPVTRRLATKGSELEKGMKAAGRSWLQS